MFVAGDEAKGDIFQTSYSCKWWYFSPYMNTKYAKGEGEVRRAKDSSPCCK